VWLSGLLSRRLSTLGPPRRLPPWWLWRRLSLGWLLPWLSMGLLLWGLPLRWWPLLGGDVLGLLWSPDVGWCLGVVDVSVARVLVRRAEDVPECEHEADGRDEEGHRRRERRW